VDQHKDQVEVLFMGSSMMFTAVMPQFSDVPALNLGLPLENMYTSLRMVSHLQSQLPKLHTVVISVSPNNLFMSDHTLNTSERDYWLRFGLPMETGVEQVFAVTSNTPQRTLELVPGIDWDFPIHPATVGISTHPTELGHIYYENAGPVDFEKLSQMQCIPTESNVHPRFMDANVRWIQNWFAHNQLGDIRIVFITIPNHHDCFTRIPEDWNTLFSVGMSTVLDSCNGCEFVDYTAQEYLQQSEYFADAVHMTLRGASTFTRVLLTDLGLPLSPQGLVSDLP
jgi:hypothetical protein